MIKINMAGTEQIPDYLSNLQIFKHNCCWGCKSDCVISGLQWNAAFYYETVSEEEVLSLKTV